MKGYAKGEVVNFTVRYPLAVVENPDCTWRDAKYYTRVVRQDRLFTSLYDGPWVIAADDDYLDDCAEKE